VRGLRLTRRCRAGKTLTDECKAELASFKIDQGENINKNLPLGASLLPGLDHHQ